MASDAVLEGLQRKLQTANSPVVARHAVAGIFATLRKAGSTTVDVRNSIITTCLTRPNKVIAQEASEQLLSLSLGGGLPASEAVELFLSALATAGPATAPPLVDALTRLLVARGEAGEGSPAAGGAVGATSSTGSVRLGRWTSHPLVSALLACPAASSQLLTAATAALSAAAAAAAAAAGAAPPSAAASAAAFAALDRTWACFEPLFSFVLLQRHAPPPAASASTSSASGAAPSTSASASASASATGLATAALGCWLQGQLVRLAAGAPPALASIRLRVLSCLTAHLALGPRGAEVDRMRAVQSTTDLLDVLEAIWYDLGHDGGSSTSAAAATDRSSSAALEAEAAAAAAALAAALLQLAFELLFGTGGGGGGGAGGGGTADVLAAMLRLTETSPAAFRGHLAALSLLTLAAGDKEAHCLYRLMHRTLQSSGGGGGGGGGADASLCLQPLLSTIAFSTAASHSAAAAGAAAPGVWAAALTEALQRRLDGAGGAAADGADGSGDGETTYGDLCLHRQCRRLLLALWSAFDAPKSTAVAAPPGDLLRWLHSLELTLRQRRRAAAAGRAAAAQLPFAVRMSDSAAGAAADGGASALDAHPAVACLLGALLAHPAAAARAAAAAAARELVLLVPAAALPLLPLVMYQLRRGSGSSASATADGAAAAAAAQLALLQLLPAMAADAGVAPYVLRVLQPLLGPGGPEALRCLGLKLLCDTWLSSGRGWALAESTLNGLTAPGGPEPPPCLRVARAALVRAVCDRDPGRGAELVGALQQCIRDDGGGEGAVGPGGARPLPACVPAAALGLEAMGILAEEDVLDFYTAYKVVHRWHPRLPAHPLLAARWVGLLGGGALDAEARPEAAAAVLDVLWAATKHTEPLVRGAAYGAIARYPLDALERLEILRPMCQYTAPLLAETDPRAAEPAAALAAAALRFEHANRRRLLLSTPAADAPSASATAAEPTAGADGAAAAGSASGSGRAAGGGGGDKGAAFAAAATAREARALRGRLMGRIAKSLLSGGGGGGGGGGGAFHPGAMLFCYSRPPPPPLPPGASAAAAAAAAKRAAADGREAYTQRLRDGLRRLSWRGPWHPRLAVQAWCSFVHHWLDETGLSAADAAAALAAEWDGSTAAGAAGSGGAAGALTAAAGGGGGAAPAAVLEGIGLAAGALCLAAEALPEADVSAITARLLQQAQAGRSSAITRGCMLGAALAATRLHPTDWATRQQVLSELRTQLLAGPTAAVRSGAATALALLAGSLAADPAVYVRAGGADGEPSRELTAVAEALAALSAVLAGACPRLAPALAELSSSGLPPGWPHPDKLRPPRPLTDEADEQDVLAGAAVGLVSLLVDVNRAHGLAAGAFGGLLAALLEVAADDGSGGGSSGSGGGGLGGVLGFKQAVTSDAAAAAALEAVAALAAEALRYQQLPVAELSRTLAMLRRLYGNPAADGRVRGAAAVAAGSLLAAAVRQGMLSAATLSAAGLQVPAAALAADAPPTAAATAGAAALVSDLAALAEASGAAAKGQHTAAARAGGVAGLAAALLPPPTSLVDALGPISSGSVSTGLLASPDLLPAAKAAVKALERFALEPSGGAAADPWASATAAFHLAALSAAVEAAEAEDEAGGGGGGEGRSGAGRDVAGGESEAGGGGGGGGGGAGGGGSAGGPKALSLYPPEGAVRPLVTALMDRARLSSLPHAPLASTVLALACAPALPSADWPSAVRALLAISLPSIGSGSGSGDLRLAGATLLLALAHGRVASLGLGPVLEELAAPARFAALPPSLRLLIVARLPALLRSLSSKRAAAVVQSIPGLLAAAAAAAAPSSGSGGEGVQGREDGLPWSCTAGLDEPGLGVVWLRRLRGAFGPTAASAGGAAAAAVGAVGGGGYLAAHAWLGLLGVCRAWQAKDSALTHRDVTSAAHTAIAALASQLPPLPPLEPGEAAQLMAWASEPLPSAAAAAAAAAASTASAAAGGGAGNEWEGNSPAWRPLALEADAVAAPPASASAAGGAAAAARAAVALWSVAALCLRGLRPDFLTAQVLADASTAPPAGTAAAAAAAAGTSPAAATAALQLRCVLVAAGHVSYRELMPVRSAVTAATADGGALLLPLALSMAATPQAFQVQVLLQTLDAARTSPHLAAPLELAAALVATVLTYPGASGAAAAGSGAAAAAAPAAPELAVLLSSFSSGRAGRTAGVIQCLPYTLPRLLARPPWSSSCEAVAQSLLAVAREGLRRAPGGLGFVPGAKGGHVGGGADVAAGGEGEAQRVVVACLWGLRDVLPPYTYDQVQSALGWRVLAPVRVQG
ncbi:hypothetical protein HYH03_013343 [Edaphochlamys debaryana]|uniref:DUF3730 domain-containing protein n=1 Tax=Edaphochlamys debaryana TaxID=47281 RepID=A0A836BTF0_9CHLO|nr:hypothetical protein HYH03_013343 [Edaphochlamys debaryana]|eukprot:KAG2488037.1 hypothetical protein HYH03_013343 [Edaphochlamys debaryana]